MPPAHMALLPLAAMVRKHQPACKLCLNTCIALQSQCSNPLGLHRWHAASLHALVSAIACAGKQQSMTGVAVKTLQQALPDACVLYSSATGASGTALLKQGKQLLCLLSVPVSLQCWRPGGA